MGPIGERRCCDFSKGLWQMMEADQERKWRKKIKLSSDGDVRQKLRNLRPFPVSSSLFFLHLTSCWCKRLENETFHESYSDCDMTPALTWTVRSVMMLSNRWCGMPDTNVFCCFRLYTWCFPLKNALTAYNLGEMLEKEISSPHDCDFAQSFLSKWHLRNF